MKTCAFWKGLPTIRNNLSILNNTPGLTLMSQDLSCLETEAFCYWAVEKVVFAAF